MKYLHLTGDEASQYLTIDHDAIERHERQVTRNLYLVTREIVRIDDLTCEVTPRGFLMLREPDVPYYGGRLVDGQIWKVRDDVGRWLLLEAIDMGHLGFIEVKARYLKIFYTTTATAKEKLEL